MEEILKDIEGYETKYKVSNDYFLYGLSSSNTPELIRYIGFSKNPDKRLNEHLRDVNRKKVKTHKKNWIKKELNFGNSIVITILERFSNRESVVLAEKNYIKLFKSIGANLVNGTIGGDGVVWTEDVRIKILTAKKGFKHSNETKKIMSKSRKGKKLSDKTKEKISKANKGKCGRVWTEEEKNKLSKSLKGKKSPLNGRILSDDIKQKISIKKTGIASKKRKPVKQLNTNYELINVFSSLTEAQNITKINNINRCVIGNGKTAGGYIWQYA